jgi:predicted transcriptional regulator
VGHSEHLLEQAGLTVRQVRDVTDAVASVSNKWQEARAKRREQLVALEGQESFKGLQRFLDAVYTLAHERRLSRYMYLGKKPASPITA